MTVLNQPYGMIGSRGELLQFDGVKYSLLAEGLTGISHYPVSHDSTATPGMIGELYHTSTIGKRLLSFVLMVYGANRAELETNRSAFISAINPIYGKSVLLWKRANGVIVALDVIPDDGTPSFRNDGLENATSWKGYCDFIAFDPCYYDENEVESTVQGYIGGFTLPFRVPFTLGTSDSLASLYNNGDTPTPCIITLTGMMENPIVTNVTTGEFISVRRTIADNETLVINTKHGSKSVTLIDSDDVETNALNYVTSTSKFFQLAPGFNTIRFTATTQGINASGKLAYNPRWISL